MDIHSGSFCSQYRLWCGPHQTLWFIVWSTVPFILRRPIIAENLKLCLWWMPRPESIKQTSECQFITLDRFEVFVGTNGFEHFFKDECVREFAGNQWHNLDKWPEYCWSNSLRVLCWMKFYSFGSGLFEESVLFQRWTLLNRYVRSVQWIFIVKLPSKLEYSVFSVVFTIFLIISHISRLSFVHIFSFNLSSDFENNVKVFDVIYRNFYCQMWDRNSCRQAE